ncbi:MAG: hypothetical protein ABI947_14485 [Chloroflexota bacterium]
MDQDTRVTLNTVLVLLMGIVQFFLRRGPHQARVEDLERRVEALEQQVRELQPPLSR